MPTLNRLTSCRSMRSGCQWLTMSSSDSSARSAIVRGRTNVVASERSVFVLFNVLVFQRRVAFVVVLTICHASFRTVPLCRQRP